MSRAGPTVPSDLRDPRLRARTSDAALRQYFSELTATANRVGAPIFAIDGRVFPAGASPPDDVDPAIWSRHLLATQWTLRALAERTGGIALLDARDFPEALAEIRDRARD